MPISRPTADGFDRPPCSGPTCSGMKLGAREWPPPKSSAAPTRWGATLGAALFALGGCSSGPVHQDDGPPLSVESRAVSAILDAVPRVEAPSRYGNPGTYVVHGQRYATLRSSDKFVQRGVASWYGRKFHGRRTSSGEPYDMFAMTAAHRELPLPTYARVTHLANGRSVTVRINDRGPFHPNRVIDLSYAAATRLGIVKAGTGLVEVRAIDPRAPLTAASGPQSRAGKARRVDIYLQVGAFEDRVNAEGMARSVAGAATSSANGANGADGAIGVRTQIEPGVRAGRTLYRVRLGPLSNVEAADSLSERLLAFGVQAAVIVQDQPAMRPR